MVDWLPLLLRQSGLFCDGRELGIAYSWSEDQGVGRLVLLILGLVLQSRWNIPGSGKVDSASALVWIILYLRRRRKSIFQN